MLYYVYITQNGEPKTGLSPDFQSLLTAENGTDKSGSAPTITEVDGGMYYFTVVYGDAPWDVKTEDLVGVINADPSDAEGMAALERYIPIVLSRYSGLGLPIESTLASTGLENILTTEPTGVATTFRGMIVQLWMRFFNKVEKNSTQIVVYKQDDTISTSQTYTGSGSNSTINEPD